MRTTLTLDADVARTIEEETYRTRRPLKQVVNDAIRRGMRAPVDDAESAPYRVIPHRTTFMPGIDPSMSMNRLADELEDKAILERLLPFE